MLKFVVFTVLLIGSALAQQIDFSKQAEGVGVAVDDLCKKAGVTDDAVITNVKDGIKQFTTCMTQFINFTTVNNEIEEAKPRGALDEVFKKYCDRSAELKDCINSLVTAVTPCVDESLRGYTADVRNATDQLIDFVCYKDGDRIALFIAEEGPKCFISKADPIKACAEKIKESVPDYTTAQKLSKADRCAKFDELGECVVKTLESCETPTPGNMAESLFRFIKRGSPCKKE